MARPEDQAGEDPNVGPEDRAYTPDTIEANRSIQQGGGVGARDLNVQADAAGAARDLSALGLDDDDLQDDGGLDAGAQQGGDRTARPDRAEAQTGQGPKTLEAQRDQVERR